MLGDGVCVTQQWSQDVSNSKQMYHRHAVRDNKQEYNRSGVVPCRQEIRRQDLRKRVSDNSQRRLVVQLLQSISNVLRMVWSNVTYTREGEI